MTYAELVERYGLTMTATREGIPPAPKNESEPEMDWLIHAHHWRCILSRVVDGERRSMTVHFHMGSALHEVPSIEEVLVSLSLDASGYDATDFEGWAEECGYNPDSRNAEAIWKTVGRQNRSLARLLGDSGFAELCRLVEGGDGE